MSNRCVFFMVLALGGCAGPIVHERPAAPVPAAWDAGIPQTVQSSAGGRTAPSAHWRDFFQDPRLQALLELTLQNNRDIRIAAARVQEARAQFGLARAERFPQIGLTGSSSYSGLPADLSGTGGYATGQRLDLGLTVASFELDFWGRLANLNESARQQFLATESAQRAVTLSIVAEVASAHFSLLQSEVLVRDALEVVRLREESLKVVKGGVAVGATHGLESEQVAGQLESARAVLAGASHQHTLAMNRLNFLTGFSAVGHTLPQARALSDQGIDFALPGPLSSEVLLQRPDVLAAEQRLAATQSNVAAVRAAYFPRIALTAGVGVASQALAGLFSGGAWNFQPVLTLPLFDFGRNAAALDAATARQNVAVAEYEKTIQNAFREVADLLSARQSLSLQLRAAELTLASQHSRMRAIQARYEAGLIGYLEVLELQREGIVAQQTVQQIRRSQLEVATQLYKALGAV